jgi:hypothetical protein
LGPVPDRISATSLSARKFVKKLIQPTANRLSIYMIGKRSNPTPVGRPLIMPQHICLLRQSLATAITIRRPPQP